EVSSEILEIPLAPFPDVVHDERRQAISATVPFTTYVFVNDARQCLRAFNLVAIQRRKGMHPARADCLQTLALSIATFSNANARNRAQGLGDGPRSPGRQTRR